MRVFVAVLGLAALCATTAYATPRPFDFQGAELGLTVKKFRKQFPGAHCYPSQDRDEANAGVEYCERVDDSPPEYGASEEPLYYFFRGRLVVILLVTADRGAANNFARAHDALTNKFGAPWGRTTEGGYVWLRGEQQIVLAKGGVDAVYCNFGSTRFCVEYAVARARHEMMDAIDAQRIPPLPRY